MTEIILGKSLEDGKNVTINLERLLETRMLVSANSGGGKSFLLRRLMEQTHGKAQHIILDMEGEFQTLREKYDYLLVGKDGDIPLNPRTAELLAKKLLELGVSTIIDLYELKHQERVHFVKLFLDAMINAPKELWHPVLVFIDEAHQLAPEKGESEALDSVIGLCERGRKRGFCAVLATQRLAKLNKDAAAEANNKLIGRASLDIDRNRSGEELGLTSKADILALRDLEAGEFYAFGTAIAKKVEKVKVGSVNTSHPKIGKRLTSISTPAPEKIKKLIEKSLADLPKEAEAELTDRTALKRRVRELEAELRKKTPIVDEKAAERAFSQGYEKAKRELTTLFNESKKQYEKTIADLRRNFKTQMQLQDEHMRQLDEFTKKALRNYAGVRKIAEKDLQIPIIPPVNLPAIKAHSEPNPVEQVAKATYRPSAQAETVESNGDGKIYSGAMRILKAVVMFHPNPITVNRAAVLSGISSSSGTFRTYFGNLRNKGWITKRGNLLEATEEGIAAAGTTEELPTDSQELIDWWAGKFYSGASRMLKAIASRYPDGITKQELGDEAGIAPESGTFRTYLGNLRRAGLIDTQGDTITATKDLFME